MELVNGARSCPDADLVRQKIGIALMLVEARVVIKVIAQIIPACIVILR